MSQRSRDCWGLLLIRALTTGTGDRRVLGSYLKIQAGEASTFGHQLLEHYRSTSLTSTGFGEPSTSEHRGACTEAQRLPGHLLFDEVDLVESTPSGSQDHAVFPMQATDGPTGQVPGAKPSPNNMPVSWYNVQDLQQVLWANAEGTKRRTCFDLLKRTWKKSVWSEEDDEKMTLPDPEVPEVLPSLRPADSPGLGG